MILITGASGLLGQHLLEELSASNKKIRALYKNKIPHFFTKINSSNIEWMECDITDIASLEKAFENIKQVYHVAAIVSYDPHRKEEMMEVNIEGTANVVNLCLDYKIEKLLHVSSISTIGEGITGSLASEKEDWEEDSKNSNYSKSKHGAEMEVWRGIAEGLQAVIINPGIVLGEGDSSKSSTHLFRIVYDEFPYYTQGVTAWVDAKDVVKAMVILMNSDIINQRFIVSAGNFSYFEIFTLIAHAMNKKPPYKLASAFMTELVWQFSYLKSLITGKVATITKETARSSQTVKRFDNSKLLKSLDGFEYTNINDTIRRTSEFMIALQRTHGY